MKISLSVSELQEVIKKAQKCMVKGSVRLPVLSSVKFSALHNTITVTVNTLEVVTVFTLSGSIQEQGEMLVSSDTLKLISKLKNTYEITISENLITAGSKTLKFISYDLDLFPITIDECTLSGFNITQQDLIKALSVNYASGIEDNRPVFNSVCLDQNTFVATDTHRMAWYRANINNSMEKQVVIPLQVTKLLTSSLLSKKGNTFPVTVSHDEKYRHLKFEFENILVITRLIDATFPNFKQVIPDSSGIKTTVKLSAQKLLDELSFIGDIAKGDNKIITMAIDENNIYFDAKTEGNTITLEVNSDITGEHIECMGIDYKMLIDAIKNQEGEEIEIKFSGTYSPLLFNNSIVLPIKVEGMKRLNVA